MIKIFWEETHKKNLFEIAVDEYVKLWEKDSYGEQYKFEILSDLNEKLDKNEIGAENIGNIVSRLDSSNPTSGSFAHWSAIDNLENLAEKDSERMSEALDYLINSDDELSRRISYFRETGKEIDDDVTLGTPLIGYILAAFDRKRYGIYLDRAMRDFTELFQIDCPGSVSEKYSLYCEFCEQIVDYMLEENFLEEFNVIYAQDFIFLLSQHDDYRFETFLRYLVDMARKLKKYKESLEEFLNVIKQMDKDYLRNQKDKYENEEKIKKIRFKILEGILSDKDDIEQKDVVDISETVNENYEGDILQNWSDFSILFQIYYNSIKNQINYIVGECHEVLRDKMSDVISEEGAHFKKGAAIKGFDWNQNYGTDRCWLALYPEEKDSHKDSAQLFLTVSGKKIEYGLYVGGNLKEKLEGVSDDLEKTSPDNRPGLGDVLDKFEDVYEPFVEINNGSAPGELVDPFSTIFTDKEEAHRVFDLMKDICEKLEINDKENGKIAVTVREYGDKTGLHLNYTNLKAFGIYGGDIDLDERILISLSEEIGSKYDLKENVNFSSVGGRNTGLFHASLEDIIDSDARLRDDYFAALEHIRKQKENYEKSPYWKSHRKKLAEAIFNSELRDEIFSRGISPETKNYFWLTSRTAEIDFTEKEKGDLIDFHVINQAGDRAGSKKRLQNDIEKIGEGDMIVGYHSVRQKKGIWALLEVKERIPQEEIIRMEIIEKLTDPLDKSDVGKVITEELNFRGKTVIELSAEVYEEIEETFHDHLSRGNDIDVDEPVPIPDLDFANIEIDIGDALHFPTADRERLKEQIRINLKKGKHIILTGPPGTGKSKLAKIIAENYVEDNYTMVTATSDWSTFDTIGGYRPGQEGSLSFDSGVFLSCFKNNGGEPDNCWLVLDEINRADIDKAFGPLFSALTGDEITLSFKTDDDENIKIEPQENREKVIPRQEIYIVPEDWRLIATMNTYDKTSLYEMSYAFMRRFAFIPVTIPENKDIDESLVGSYLDCWEIDNYEYTLQVAELWKKINNVRKIGPAIVKDLYSYLVAGDDFTSPIINFVLPQFEGARKSSIIEFINDLEDLKTNEEEGVIPENKIDTDRIRSFADDYFRLEGDAIGS